MSDAADIFQAFASLPNLPKDELKSELHRLIGEGLHFLASALPDARADYLGALAERARHHAGRAHGFAASQRESEAVAIESSGPQGHLLRDFYHDAYYSLFYVARYLLVSIGSYDCSDHRHIDKIVMEEVRRLLKDQTERGETAALLVADLAAWREYRIVADYIINSRRLAALSSLQQIQTIDGSLTAHFSAWDVP